MPFIRTVRFGLVRRLWPLGCMCGIGLVATPELHALHPSAFLSALSSWRASAPKAVRENWMEIYLGPTKIGHAHLRIMPTTYQNRPALQMDSERLTRLNVLGALVEQKETRRTITDTDSNPLTQVLDVRSNGSEIHLEAVYDYGAHRVSCRLNTGGATTEKTLDIPPNAVLTADADFLTQGRTLAVGQKFKLVFLDPMRLTLDEAQVEVTGRGTVRDRMTGAYASAFTLQSHRSLGDMVSWQTDNGDTVKAETTVGGLRITLNREPRALALRGDDARATESKIYAPPIDFAIATSVKLERPLLGERTARGVRVTVEGLPEKRLLLEDARQKIQIVPTANSATLTARYEIAASSFDASQSASAPVIDRALAPYLSKAAYLNINDINIQSESYRLRRRETNLYRIAVRIRDWVNKNMTPDAGAGVPRSASDIFLKRRGVCRDYATLYTALARAAGVPTRLCAGIVYSNGMFFYHVWAESYVGQWIPFDPTLYDPARPVEYVDATHIKFAQGDVTDMLDALSVVGKLRITALATTP